MGFDLSDYEPVEDRLAKFWEDYPSGRIATQLQPSPEGAWIVAAQAYRDISDPHPAATGLAQETVGSSGVNRTSALENCETSAIGRCLANMGYAPKGKRASREEMAKVTHNSQPSPNPKPALEPVPGQPGFVRTEAPSEKALIIPLRKKIRTMDPKFEENHKSLDSYTLEELEGIAEQLSKVRLDV